MCLARRETLAFQQSDKVVLVRVDRLGFRARGLLADDPRPFLILGGIVVAPCSGRVVGAEDGAPDMSPPRPDRSHMAGNYVILDSGGTWVLLLGHVQRGSVAVKEGDVATGVALGRVSNSGNTSEPHLHIHAQRPGSAAEPMRASPWPFGSTVATWFATHVSPPTRERVGLHHAESGVVGRGGGQAGTYCPCLRMPLSRGGLDGAGPEAQGHRPRRVVRSIDEPIPRPPCLGGLHSPSRGC